MADWKQITARIRRARTGKDPVGQLSGLFEKTRDAMVAFELARVLETSGQNSDAAKWYVAAAERFRRADWKSKAQEAAVRLGADIAAASADSSAEAAPVSADASESQPSASPDSGEAEVPAAAISENGESAEESSEPSAAEPAQTEERKRRRRGRRGGRNRGRGDAAPTSTRTSSRSSSATPTPAAHSRAASAAPEEAAESESPAPPARRGVAHVSVESGAEFSVASVRGRSGDPGLSSRLSALEMQLRRLLSCVPAKLGDADHAPAGPGVLVLGDSDLTSYYYVEACQTLRIAVSNLLRGGGNRRGMESIKPRLAEHLGIPEARVSKYLADHCVVRWLQLDEGASHFAHFVIATLRPALNE